MFKFKGYYYKPRALRNWDNGKQFGTWVGKQSSSQNNETSDPPTPSKASICVLICIIIVILYNIINDIFINK